MGLKERCILQPTPKTRHTNAEFSSVTACDDLQQNIRSLNINGHSAKSQKALLKSTGVAGAQSTAEKGTLERCPAHLFIHFFTDDDMLQAGILSIAQSVLPFTFH